MDAFSNITLFATPSDARHVITVGYASDNLAAKVHVHAISDITGLAAQLATFVTQTALSQTLTDYVTDTDLANTLTAYATTASVTATLEAYMTTAAFNTAIADYATSAEVSLAISAYAATVTATYATKAELAGYSVVGHQHTVETVQAVPASGIITLERDKTQYIKTVTANTVIGFDATALNLGANDAATFELVVKMGPQLKQVLFGSNVTWLNSVEPYFHTSNCSYLFAFRTYDGGNSWVGAYQGVF